MCACTRAPGKGLDQPGKGAGISLEKGVISLEKGVISLDGCLELGEGWLCFGVPFGTASVAMACGRLGVKAAFYIQNGAGFPVPRQL